ncbi:LAETG motif-containing sortase-dependent surface protein [Actinoplanes oblitus]|uniref:LAETG motif-containing sortase-dependent surface protein n=1 Tax=Actinoplanes oblitus TaxID=3040509 RepID=A0ABY8WCA0_9ACTN|nr:LAETG motif-containing sortase-dependent surface protein [Actinoplanes oblitus]WIM95494.1 LAETG motif-containing sortase-dependent surface protein [Actinoplanes oblitus]
MKKARFLRAAVVLASALLGAGVMATPSYADEPNTGGTGTTNNCKATDFDNAGWDFKSEPGKAKITASLKSTSTCENDVTLVSYLAPRPDFAVPQYLFAQETYHFDGKHTSHEFVVDVPDCNTQVDLFVGGKDVVIPELKEGGSRYNDLKINWKNFGTSKCVQPAVQHTEACNGDVTLNLSNNGKLSGYDVTFVVRYGYQTKMVTVGKGKSEDLLVPAGSGAITVTADKLAETKIEWSRPAECKPTATATNDCKTTVVTVNNPKGNGEVPAKVTYNGETQTVTVPAGSSKDVTFKSADATVDAKVEFPDTSLEGITVQVELGKCSTPEEPTTPVTTSPAATPSATTSATPSQTASASASASTSPAAATPSTSETEGGALALTGSNSSTIAGGAVVLLLVGAGLFFMARRRKLNFKA